MTANPACRNTQNNACNQGASIDDSLLNSLNSAMFRHGPPSKFGGLGVWEHVHSAVAETAGSLTAIVKPAVHGAISGAISVAQGGDFLSGFAGGAAGAIGGMLGVKLFPQGFGEGFAANPGGFVGRTTIAAIAGGTGSAIGGGKFVNGAVTAAFAHMYNAEGGHAGRFKKMWEDRIRAGWRPDSDGILTINEARIWWRFGQGRTLTINLSSLDLSGVQASDFPKGIGDRIYVNLFNPNYGARISDALLYGNIRLELVGTNTVRGFFDVYDFDHQPNGNPIRNGLTWLGSQSHPAGKDFRINFSGTARIGR